VDFHIDPAWVVASVTSIITALVTAVGITYRGQIKALTDENQFLRGLLLGSTGVQKDQSKILDRAVTLAELRAEVRRKEDPT
jgi:hypothetical protein